MKDILSEYSSQVVSDLAGEKILLVEPLGQGGWAEAYKVVVPTQVVVVRWSDHRENFERDAQAAYFGNSMLPVPKIIEIGSRFNKVYAVSEFVEGNYFELLDHKDLELALPSMEAVIKAIREVDLTVARGFGHWNRSLEGESSSWKDFLLGVKAERNQSLVGGWKNNLLAWDGGEKLFDDLYIELEGLVSRCPEDRQLIHSDLLNFNVLVADNRVSAVLDWGSSMFGDCLYDIAWFMFYEPWYPLFGELGVIERLKAGFLETKLAKTNMEERLIAYQVHIGLDSIVYNAFKNDKNSAKEAQSRVWEILKK